MKELSSEIHVLLNSAAQNIVLAADEYIDPADGLIHCKSCGNGAVDIEQEKLFIFQTSQLCGIAVNVLRVKSIHNYPHF